jgi:ABC-type polysaccharide/polyol phosphate export permease
VIRVSGLFGQLLHRDIRSRFIGSATGWIWLLVTPLLLLAVYAFVFGVIFRARVPEGFELPFWAWLAVALWPWLAFSEGLQRAAGSMQQHAALISKVAIPRHLLVNTSVCAVFVLHAIGFVVVLLVIQGLAAAIHWLALPYVLLILAVLYVFALGLGFLLASIQVFVRDMEQLLPTALMFWFFLTPIIYPSELLPEAARGLLILNPMTWWVEELRLALFSGKFLPDQTFLLMVAVATGFLLAGRAVFNRLSPHFEDFL